MKKVWIGLLKKLLKMGTSKRKRGSELMVDFPAPFEEIFVPAIFLLALQWT